MARVFKCKVCSLQFEVFGNARRHVRDKHGSESYDLLEAVKVNGNHKTS